MLCLTANELRWAWYHSPPQLANAALAAYQAHIKACPICQGRIREDCERAANAVHPELEPEGEK